MPNGSEGAFFIRTPDQRLRVFVSSTMAELADERRAAAEAVRSLHLTPILFEIGARARPPREIYTAYLQQSDVFVGIYGRKYGWVNLDVGISGIEDEYDLAVQKPRLIYVKAVPDRDQRLAELLDRITAEGQVSYKPFSSPDELRGLIENDLAVLLTERFQGAPIGGDVPASGLEAGASHWQAPPRPLTRLVGQKGLLSTASRLLTRGKARLVVLTGPGGIGKTRLAMEITDRIRPHFADGVAWVDLASIREDELVLPAVARSIRLPEKQRGSSGPADTEPLLQSLAERLGTSHALIVLDNFEQVLGSAALLPELLQRCQGLSMLVTSRESLRVRGEHEVRVEPLALVEPDADETRESVLKAEAAQLLMERASAAVPGFRVTDINAGAIADLCARVDGLPLGLELAAAHLRYLSPQDLLERIETGSVPASVFSDLPSRHQSLHATLDWSHRLLTDSQRVLFRRVSVLADGFSLEAVPAVCGWDAPAADVLGDMYSLVDKSLVRRLNTPDEAARFGMFVTIREYAAKQLSASGEAESVHERHARYYCDLAETAERLMTGPERQVWLSVLDTEVANLRNALAWTLDSGDLGLGLRLAGALGWYWNIAGRLIEGSRWIAALLARPWDGCGDEEQARALYAAATIAWRSERFEEARARIDRAVALRRTLEDRRRLALVLSALGLIETSGGNYEAALAAHEEAYSIFERLGDEWGIAYALSNSGDVYLETNDLTRAKDCYLEGLARFSKTGDLWGQAIVLQTLGNVAWRERDVSAARGYYEQAVENWGRMGMPGNAGSITSLAAVNLFEGDVAAARELLVRGMDIWRSLGSMSGVSVCLEGLAAVRSSEGDDREAALLLGAAVAHRGANPPPFAVEADLFAGRLQHARHNLGDGEFEMAMLEGREMGIDDALVRAINQASAAARQSQRTNPA